MAYKTGLLAITLEDVDQTFLSVKGYCQAFNLRSLAGDVPSGAILDLFRRLRTDRARLAQLSATPGIAAYAQSQKNDGTFDIVAEFTAALNAVDNCTSWIQANFPKDANGFLLSQTLGSDTTSDRLFSTAALAGLRAVVSAVIAQIV